MFLTATRLDVAIRAGLCGDAAALEGTVADRFGDMMDGDRLCAGEIGDGACDACDAIESTSGEMAFRRRGA